jgi:hypothetical protein
VTKKRKLTKKRKRVSKPKSRKSHKLIRKVRSSSYKNKKKRRSFKKHKGGSDPDPFTSNIEAIPHLIDDNDSLTGSQANYSLTESQVNELEYDLANDSWASYTPATSTDSSFDEGNTTREDNSDDVEDDDNDDDNDDDDDDELNTAFDEEN